MVAHPAQREHEIEDAGVAGISELLAAEFGEIEMAEDVERWLTVTTTTLPRRLNRAPSLSVSLLVALE